MMVTPCSMVQSWTCSSHRRADADLDRAVRIDQLVLDGVIEDRAVGVDAGRNCPARCRHGRRNERAPAACPGAWRATRSSGSVMPCSPPSATRWSIGDACCSISAQAVGDVAERDREIADIGQRQRGRIDAPSADGRRRPACGSPGGWPPARSGRRRGWWCRCRSGMPATQNSASRSWRCDAEEGRRQRRRSERRSWLVTRTGRPRPRPHRSSGRRCRPAEAAVIDVLSMMSWLVS